VLDIAPAAGQNPGMDNADLLSAEDNLFGRVALYNKLVTADQVAECTRAIFVEAVAGLPRRRLAEIMVTQGYISPQVADSISEAVRGRLGTAAGKSELDAPPPPPPPPPLAPPPPPVPEARPAGSGRAGAGASRVMVRPEPGCGPEGRRIWVDAPEGGDEAAVVVSCAYLYPNDARDLELACRRLLDLGRRDLRIDMRAVDYVPSVILGELARAGLSAAGRGLRITVLAKAKVAAVAEMVIGRIVAVVSEAP